MPHPLPIILPTIPKLMRQFNLILDRRAIPLPISLEPPAFPCLDNNLDTTMMMIMI